MNAITTEQIAAITDTGNGGTPALLAWSLFSAGQTNTKDMKAFHPVWRGVRPFFYDTHQLSDKKSMFEAYIDFI